MSDKNACAQQFEKYRHYLNHHKRIEADETPACGIETPAVFAKGRQKIPSALFCYQLRRGRADRRRIVADVMIAGKVPAADGKRIVQYFGKVEIIAIGRPIECDVAAVNDEVRTFGVDVFAHPMKIVGKFGHAAGKDGCRKSGSAEIRSFTLPSRSTTRLRV
jgi:hypothetical protein